MSDDGDTGPAYFVPKPIHPLVGRLTIASELLANKGFGSWELLVDATKEGGAPAPTPDAYAMQLEYFVREDTADTSRADKLRASAALGKCRVMDEGKAFWTEDGIDGKDLVARTNDNFEAGLVTALKWAAELGDDAEMEDKPDEGDEDNSTTSATVPTAEVCAIRIWNEVSTAEAAPRKRAAEEAAALAAQPGAVWLRAHGTKLKIKLPTQLRKYIDRRDMEVDEYLALSSEERSGTIWATMYPAAVKGLDDGYIEAPLDAETSADLRTVGGEMDSLDKHSREDMVAGAVLDFIGDKLAQENEFWEDEEAVAAFGAQLTHAHHTVLVELGKLPELRRLGIKQSWDEDAQQTPYLQDLWNIVANTLDSYTRSKSDEYEGGSFPIEYPIVGLVGKKKKQKQVAPIPEEVVYDLSSKLRDLDFKRDSGTRAAVACTQLILEHLVQYNWEMWSQGLDSAKARYAAILAGHESVKKSLKELRENPDTKDGVEISTREPEGEDDFTAEIWNRMIAGMSDNP